MQYQLLFVEMFSLAEVLVSVLEGYVVFLTCGMLCSWGRAWKHQGSVGTTQLSCCCIFGQKSAGIGWNRGWGSRGSASTWDEGCTRSVIAEGALESWE